VSTRQRFPAHRRVTGDDELSVLSCGELEVHGRILPASNVTLVARVTLDGQSLQCVYKPVSGERPLWDFPDGSLAGREVAAYLVSEALGWDVVPLTIERDGPLGRGMVQVWREPDDEQDPVDLVPEGEVPDGYLHVLDAADGEGRPVSLVHEDSPGLHRMAVFDAVVNNADRKGGHVLAMPDGHRYGVDHGVCFHAAPKLRTVLWGWATLPLREDEREALTGLVEDVAAGDGALRSALDERLSHAEVTALRTRCERLLARNRMPVPSGEWPAIPWPAF
jgi:uncharacterized repeat protein (TIGR03843 family)